MNWTKRVVNPLVRTVLRSRWHRVLSRSVMLVTFQGRVSGRWFTTPVMYVETGDDVVVVVGAWQRKQWWRNFLTPAAAVVRIQGEDRPVLGEALHGDDRTDQVAEFIRAYVQRFPRAKRALHAEGFATTDESLDGWRDVAKGALVVRFHPALSD